VEQWLNTRRGTVKIHKKAQFVQTRLFYGLQLIEIVKLIQSISHKVYYVNLKKLTNNFYNSIF